ncbi:hypothetical protein [Natronocalculus amylovorans]|uniref:Cell surface glycoprotein n=1 Tax=Natronocalculus amylovorans TaxID=2917812 RepID=A0AAE3FYK3_9EURY|nr:hypothetical protein [Natronocalculus amylovorans]MCL9817666.1 hypothetical protein [Natronocalculus amylovorans]
MSYPSIRSLSTVLILCVVLSVAVITVSATGYSLSIAGSFNSPEGPQEINDPDGNTLTIDELAVVDHGEDISVDAILPDADFTARVNLERIDESGEPERPAPDTTTIRGDDTVIFGTESVEPGTYVVGLYDGPIQAAVPVIVAGYDLSVTATEESSDQVRITVETTEITDSDEITQAEVLLWDEDNEVRETLSESNESTYDGSVSISSGEFDEYEIYTVVRSDTEIYEGQKDILGASEPKRLTEILTESSEDEESTETETPTETETETPTETEETPTETDTPTETETTPSPTTETETETEAGDDDRDTVITPNPTETESDDDSASDTHTSTPSQTDDTTPLPVWLSIGGLLLLTLLAARPTDRDHKKQ